MQYLINYKTKEIFSVQTDRICPLPVSFRIIICPISIFVMEATLLGGNSILGLSIAVDWYGYIESCIYTHTHTHTHIFRYRAEFICFYFNLKHTHLCLHMHRYTYIWLLDYMFCYIRSSLVVQLVKNPPAMQETWVWSLGWEGPLEEGMATHSSILAWRIPWTEEPGGLQSMGSHRVRHCEWLSLSLWYIRLHTHIHTLWFENVHIKLITAYTIILLCYFNVLHGFVRFVQTSRDWTK